MGHLTPSLLNHQLITFREINGYLPQIIVVHMDPAMQREIETEIAVVAEALNSKIDVAYEGMQLHT